ncbi:MAG TPA: YIP1 family protein [Phototrophicaceae bacterium]|nr:YIP1 family protein [Phototrophicaceae bacterium]
MATRVQRVSSPSAAPPIQPSGGIITQIARLIVQPKIFFEYMPASHQWLLIAILVLAVTGFTATTQIQSSTANANGGTNSTTQPSGFSLNTLNQTSTNGTAQTNDASGTNRAQTQQFPNFASTTNTASNSFMNALLAASGVIVLWAGEACFLSLVCMLRGYAPKFGKAIQIAVWSSLPLAVMLALRYAYYANGGSGGALGLSLLLDNWSGYAALPDYARRVLAVFMSNLTLFWLWSIVLLYLGGRYALGGSTSMVLLIVALWIVASTLIPALFSQPNTRSAPRFTNTGQTQTQNTTRSNGTATQTAPQGAEGDFGGFGGFGGTIPGGGGGFTGGTGRGRGNG